MATEPAAPPCACLAEIRRRFGNVTAATAEHQPLDTAVTPEVFTRLQASLDLRVAIPQGEAAAELEEVLRAKRAEILSLRQAEQQVRSDIDAAIGGAQNAQGRSAARGS